MLLEIFAILFGGYLTGGLLTLIFIWLTNYKMLRNQILMEQHWGGWAAVFGACCSTIVLWPLIWLWRMN